MMSPGVLMGGNVRMESRPRSREVIAVVHRLGWGRGFRQLSVPCARQGDDRAEAVFAMWVLCKSRGLSLLAGSS